MAKSAIMTSANPNVKSEDQTTQATPFEMGSGQVDPGKVYDKGSAFNPGLVYDAGLFEYAAYTCGAELGIFTPGSCTFLANLGVPFDASDLNYPSIGIADLPGSQTVVRTVTSVADKTVIFTANTQAPAGFDVTVTPHQLVLNPGDSASFEVTFTNKNAPVGEWHFGSLTWEGSGYEVRSPIAVKGALFNAPAEVSGSGESGSLSFNVNFGYTGSYAAAAHGLVPATVTSDTVVQDPDQTFDPNDGFSNMHQFALSGEAFFRIAMPPDAVTDPDAIDLDLYLYDPNGDQVASSTNGGTDEQIDVSAPMDGTWTLYVHGWQTAGPSANYDLYSWAISATPGGNLSIDSAPTSATNGSVETVDVSWTGATAGQWHLGAVSHTGDAGLIGLTLVNVDNR